jgi:hypothetical protein
MSTTLPDKPRREPAAHTLNLWLRDAERLTGNDRRINASRNWQGALPCLSIARIGGLGVFYGPDADAQIGVFLDARNRRIDNRIFDKLSRIPNTRYSQNIYILRP